jgi:hypothetical protein
VRNSWCWKQYYGSREWKFDCKILVCLQRIKCGDKKWKMQSNSTINNYKTKKEINKFLFWLFVETWSDVFAIVDAMMDTIQCLMSFLHYLCSLINHLCCWKNMFCVLGVHNGFTPKDNVPSWWKTKWEKTKKKKTILDVFRASQEWLMFSSFIC